MSCGYIRNGNYGEYRDSNISILYVQICQKFLLPNVFYPATYACIYCQNMPCHSFHVWIYCIVNSVQFYITTFYTMQYIKCGQYLCIPI